MSDIGSDWEEDAQEVERQAALLKAKQEKAKQAAAVASPPKPTTTGATTQQFEIPKELLKPLADPEEDRKRIEKINELRDLAMGGDMFGVDAAEAAAEARAAAAEAEAARLRAARKAGGVARAAGGRWQDSISLERVQEVEEFCAELDKKIQSSGARPEAWLRMITLLLQSCGEKMEASHLNTISNKARDMAKQKQVDAKFKALKSKKNTDLNVNIRNPQAELDVFDGVGDDDDDYDDDDDFM